MMTSSVARPRAIRRMTFAEAIVDAMATAMRDDERIFFMGQDVGRFGGALQGSQGLWEQFGPRRIIEAPISESAMVGTCIGAALFGKRPIVEISFGEFLPTAMNQIVLQAANLHYMTAGKGRVPLVLRTRVGDGPYRGHPQSYEAWFPHIPGLTVVMPSNARDAHGLMRSAIADDGPVLFFEQMALYHSRDSVPDEPFIVPIGSAHVARSGLDVTVVATGWMVQRALAAAEQVRPDGIDVEVVDLRTLAPLDRGTVLGSVRKTGRLVVAHEAWKIGGIGAEISAVVAEEAFHDLMAPIIRVGAPHVPIPSAQTLRDLVIPGVESIASAIRRVFAE